MPTLPTLCITGELDCPKRSADHDVHRQNEMVSLGDTKISLHILQLPQSGGGGGGVLGKVRFGLRKEN